MKLSQALSWAINAKNCLQMWNGFSSYQLVFGQNPNLPNVMVDQLPALEGTTTSEIVASHINALHSARRAYIEAESSERVQKALKHKVRANAAKFSTGDKVFYKRDGNNKWKGPGKVIGQDGKVVFVRHGNIYVRVSTSRLIKLGEEFQQTSEVNPKQLDSPSKEQTHIDSDNDDETPTDSTTSNSAIPEEHQQEPIKTSETATTSAPPEEHSRSLPKKNDCIRYKGSGADEWKDATVLGRAGKATGKFSTWLNIKNNGDTAPMCIDFETVQEWQKVNNDIETENDNKTEEATETAFFTIVPRAEHQTTAVIDAKKQEMHNWKN